jgi:hypothetical protein
MGRIFPTLTAVVLALACGVVHGVWTDRWQLSAEPATSAAKLSLVALNLDDWDGEAVPSDTLGRGFAGHLYHRYKHKRTGKIVTAFILCDRPGPVSIHTPNVCYSAVGYEVTSPSKYALRSNMGTPTANFWTARFNKKNSTDTSDLRIYWAWNAGGGWQAADDPRWEFARFSALYKLYLIRELPGADEGPGEDPCLDLMKQLLPELQRSLFASS